MPTAEIIALIVACVLAVGGLVVARTVALRARVAHPRLDGPTLEEALAAHRAWLRALVEAWRGAEALPELPAAAHTGHDALQTPPEPSSDAVFLGDGPPAELGAVRWRATSLTRHGPRPLVPASLALRTRAPRFLAATLAVFVLASLAALPLRAPWLIALALVGPGLYAAWLLTRRAPPWSCWLCEQGFMVATQARGEDPTVTHARYDATRWLGRRVAQVHVGRRHVATRSEARWLGPDARELRWRADAAPQTPLPPEHTLHFTLALVRAVARTQLAGRPREAGLALALVDGRQLVWHDEAVLLESKEGEILGRVALDDAEIFVETRRDGAVFVARPRGATDEAAIVVPWHAVALPILCEESWRAFLSPYRVTKDSTESV